jgi:hypothetical protein
MAAPSVDDLARSFEKMKLVERGTTSSRVAGQ